MERGKIFRRYTFFLLGFLFLVGCTSAPAPSSPVQSTAPLLRVSPAVSQGQAEQEDTGNAQPYPTRPVYEPGELVDYIAQTGDTLPALAAHFNTTVEEILQANPFIPASATTLPPGMPMQIPIYYRPFWGNPTRLLPDSLFINGPAQVGFDIQEFVANTNGWLADYHGYVAGKTRNGAQIVELVALNYSVSPRLLLALLEYQSGALTQSLSESSAVASARTPDRKNYPLGYVARQYRGLYMQLVWAANTLNNGYYGWRIGSLKRLEVHSGSRLLEEHPDPWQNAATVALQHFFSQLLDKEAYQQAVSLDGLAATYQTLFGDPWADGEGSAHIPGSLAQPELALPFQPRRTWAYTGGPHTAWGEGEPLAALDFAPPSVVGGCSDTPEWATAVAAGLVVRSEPAIVVLDLDGDGDERTGWNIFYLHIGPEDQAPVGAMLQRGDPIGHPSCAGGRATGTHVHIARKYNGEWIPADGPLAFNLEGWVAHNGPQPYLGTLTRFGRTIEACVCSDQRSQLESGMQVEGSNHQP